MSSLVIQLQRTTVGIKRGSTIPRLYVLLLELVQFDSRLVTLLHCAEQLLISWKKQKNKQRKKNIVDGEVGS